ncbi:hybrid sensor histidine kinase/response regulator [Desulfobacter hydrogenophilus]|uniref:histidine kinase n=1 Tax=Desulfobacter hydrogenophilus TaxID=2291 RepID=A0A328FGT3_9BACT|nr:ATP-binding protein [Desulfobacter hydrogenophilus]NDY73457.1 response regulator [Desulfobacter hydrogenophilus]QBH14417.1 response regulator [Desulfobacter hydrogenophilus]RAM02257.1 hybrid sensor histidine kinase/response regulator [Desulfobacter hydrogenophilus]
MSQNASYNTLIQRIKELEHENATLKQGIVAHKKSRAIDTSFGSTSADLADAINQKIEKERALLFAAVEQFSEMVYITNSEGIIQYLNPAFEHLTGFSKEECIGKDINMFRSSKHDSQFNINLRAIISSGRVWRGHAEFKKKGSSFCIMDITIFSVRDKHGTITNYVGVQQNVSNKQAINERIVQAQKLESLGTLAGGIAHDLNNMLLPIIGNAEILLFNGSAYDNQTKESLTQVYESGLQAKELVQQILTFSRQKKIQRRPLQIQDSIDTVLMLMKSGIPRNILIKKNVDPSCPPVIANSTQLHQIIMNLISNGMHAMGETGGVIKVLLKPVTVSQSDSSGGIKPGNYICLSISDTGGGISKEVRNHIFEPFYTTKGNEGGTGMGLSVVYGIVKDMAGSIKVHSQLGKGSEFRLYFPTFLEKNVELRLQTSALNEKICIKYHINVLFVDDENIILNVAKSMLDQLGCGITTMTDPLIALERFKKEPLTYDLVITDLYMPHMNGDCLAKNIREIRPDVPIFLCTGFCDDITLDMMSQIGIRAVLSKPLSIKDFSDKIGKFFKPKTSIT